MPTLYADFEYLFDDVALGIAVREWREMHGWTQDRLATTLGYKDGSSISAIECANIRGRVGLGYFVAICNLINRSPGEFFALQRADVQSA